jgi:hypothetical protein
MWVQVKSYAAERIKTFKNENVEQRISTIQFGKIASLIPQSSRKRILLKI